MRDYNAEAKQIHEQMKKDALDELKGARQDVSMLQHELKGLKGKADKDYGFTPRESADVRINDAICLTINANQAEEDLTVNEDGWIDIAITEPLVTIEKVTEICETLYPNFPSFVIDGFVTVMY